MDNLYFLDILKKLANLDNSGTFFSIATFAFLAEFSALWHQCPQLLLPNNRPQIGLPQDGFLAGSTLW
jgi:hypothetical protein